MLKVLSTNVVISKGFDNNPALKFHNGENGRSVRFRIGMKTYDPSAPNNSRWINIAVKAFNGMCDRIEKMKLDEGSYVNIYGKLDEENWNDSEGKPAYYVYYNNYGVNVPGLLIRHPLHPPTFVPFDRECGVGILKIDKSDFHLITPMEGKSNV